MSERSYYVFVCKWRGKIMNKRKRLLAILINGMLLSSLCVASAVDVTVGSGNGVAYGTGSSAPKIENVAIGDNTFARTGSTMIGSHNYKGDLGDTTVDTATTRKDALNAYATTVGANSFTNGAFATNTGTYNIISSGYNGGRMANPVKNLESTINGSLNSI